MNNNVGAYFLLVPHSADAASAENENFHELYLLKALCLDLLMNSSFAEFATHHVMDFFNSQKRARVNF